MQGSPDCPDLPRPKLPLEFASASFLRIWNSSWTSGFVDFVKYRFVSGFSWFGTGFRGTERVRSLRDGPRVIRIFQIEPFLIKNLKFSTRYSTPSFHNFNKVWPNTIRLFTKNKVKSERPWVKVDGQRWPIQTEWTIGLGDWPSTFRVSEKTYVCRMIILSASCKCFALPNKSYSVSRGNPVDTGNELGLRGWQTNVTWTSCSDANCLFCDSEKD